ncbi:MAG: tetratricopeptide repeat protein [Myxococcota bacterium]
MVWFFLPLFACQVAFAGAPTRPKVDTQAMREAMQAGDDEYFGSSSSYAHFLRSRLAHHQGDHSQALEEMRLALASDDGNPYLLTALAEEYARVGDLGRAERELRKVIETRPEYFAAQLLMGRVLFEAQRLTRAKVHLSRAIALAPSVPEPYLVLIQLWLEQGKPDEAVRVAEELGAALPGDPVGYKRLGLSFAERGDLARAERMLSRAAERDPSDFETWVALAQLYEATDRPADAEGAFAKALERDPWSREVLLAAGRVSLRMGDSVKARAYFDRLLAVSRDPELAVRVAFSYLTTRQLPAAAEVLESARAAGMREPRIHFYAGLVHEKLRRYQSAAEAYAAVEPEAGELFHEARMHRASCVSMLGQHKLALQLFREGLVDKPQYLQLRTSYARALERAGQAAQAESFLAKSIDEAPVPELFEALSSLYERQGRLADAIELLTGALASRPRDEALLFTLGATYEKKGDVARSLEKMRAVLAVNPDNALALNFIGYTLAERNLDLDEAERLLRRALELRPDTGAFLDSLGWVYFRKGDFPRAAELIERALFLTPGQPTIHEHLGDVYTHLARRQDAAGEYRRALEALREAPELADSKVQRTAIERKLKLLSTGEKGR